MDGMILQFVFIAGSYALLACLFLAGFVALLRGHKGV